MKRKNIFWIILCIVVFLNLPLWSFFLEENYTYSNVDGSFQTSEEGGKNGHFETVMMRYGGFLCQHPDKDNGDNNLYRTFTIQPWRFWEWRQMIFHSDRFWLPYKAPDRVTPVIKAK